MYRIAWVIMLLIGMWFHRDYGLSWDEPIVLEYGQQLQAYIRHGEQSFVDSFDRYHGSFPPLWMGLVDALFSDQSTQYRYFMIHLCNFFFFALGGILLSHMVHARWGERYATAMLIFYILSPRLFADAMYNTKDIPFLSLYICCSWSGLRFHKDPSYSNSVIHAALCALLISTRILGVLMLGYTGLFFLYTHRQYLHKLLLYMLLTVLILWCVWPILWVRGLWGIIEACSHMSHFPWKGEVLYQGQYIKAQELPWHYPYVWMGITIPLAHLLLAAMGLTAIKGEHQRSNLWFLMSGVSPLLLVTFMGSVIYDGWRHLYFVYPSVLWFALIGARHLILRIGERRFLSGLVIIGIACSQAWIAVRMYRLHPYQNVYFNMLAGEAHELRYRYELDYWGLSFRALIEHSIKNVGDRPLSIGVSNIAGLYTQAIIAPEDQSKFRFVSTIEKADIFISNFRWHPEEYPFTKLYSLRAEEIEIGAVYATGVPYPTQ